ncbi:hypothetical protein L1D59_07475 [Pseudoalteromonas piscicida]|uniref:hypothetical protein n=1 Tax=Pseudoalteromonas piscicida TaxID=43662 RepID=UPI001EFC5B4D|nr:hypothetical protein [Pseudoalteromonas piscicida]MCG9768447.1 hypothetical protein [Pseudoalteromonas piscicida]
MDEKLNSPMPPTTPKLNSEDLQTPVGDYRHLRNRDVENLNQLNDGLKQDLENKKRRFTEGPNPTRKPTRNRYHEDSYKLTNDGVGVDLSKEYDWEQILDNSKYLKEQRKPPFEINKIWDDVGKAWDRFSILPDEGGSTATFFLSVDFSQKQINMGKFWAIQGGPSVGLRPGVSGDIGFDASLFLDSGDFNRSMSGLFVTEGAEAEFGLGLDVESIQTIPTDGTSSISGISIFGGLASPELAGHVHGGYGGIYKDSVETINFSDVPERIFDYVTFGVFK